MKSFLLMFLLVIPMSVLADDPGYEDPPETDIVEQATGAIAQAQAGVDAWHNIKSDYETQINQLAGWADDIETLAAGEPNEQEVLDQLSLGDAELLKAALQVDLGTLDNNLAADDLSTAQSNFNATLYQAAKDYANQSLLHLDDRAVHETNTEAYIDSAYEAYYEASMLF